MKYIELSNIISKLFIGSLLYALTKSISTYGIEEVKVFVKNSSLSLAINIRDNSKEMMKNVGEFLDKAQKEINKFLIDSAIIGFILFVAYTYIHKNL